MGNKSRGRPHGTSEQNHPNADAWIADLARGTTGEYIPLAQSLAETPDFDEDHIWQELGPGPSSSAGAALRELGEFVMDSGRRASEWWVFAPQTASNSQMNMLRSVGLMPSRDAPTTFSILGVPHTAEWREANFVRLYPITER